MATKKDSSKNTRCSLEMDQRDKATLFQEAGGAEWAQRFINTAGPEYGGIALRESIRDAELLFESNKDELDHFYETLQMSCLAKKPVNPILSDSFNDSLCRAQKFAAFLEGYTDRIDSDCVLDGETEGHTMAIALLNDALRELNRQQDYAPLAEARKAHHG